MNLARVVGKVWATRKAPGLEPLPLLVIQPVDGDLKPDGALLAAADLQGSAVGQVVYFVGSKEAALPLPHKLTPVDATIVGIVDHVDR
jgi:ethanolamine utilization protein EutN